MHPNRISSIDQFRGFAILAMVLANFTGGVDLVPAWLKHAPDIGLTVIDLIAPFFIFAIGLTYGLSFRRRLDREPAAKTYSHLALRYLAILGIGAVISAGETLLGENTNGVDWGVLQAIGMAGLLTLTVIRLPTDWRVVISLVLLVVYQIILDRFMLETVLRSSHGGLFGSLSWAAMLILATALADLFHDAGKRRWFVWAVLLAGLVGAALAFVSPVSKNRVSAAYVLVTLGASGMLFSLFRLLAEKFKINLRLLAAWGKNPLALYILHYLLLGIVYLPGIPVLYSEAPLWLTLTEMAALVGGLSAVAFWMEKKKIVLSL